MTEQEERDAYRDVLMSMTSGLAVLAAVHAMPHAQLREYLEALRAAVVNKDPELIHVANQVHNTMAELADNEEAAKEGRGP